jgi:curved DNA-binding protein CbpA
MNLVDCYRILGLPAGASPGEIKSAYRRLAREYHPDVNPGNPQAEAKFIQVTSAYKHLISQVPPEAQGSRSSQTPNSRRDPHSPATPGVRITTNPRATSQGSGAGEKDRQEGYGSSAQAPGVKFSPELSETERELKRQSYHQLRERLQTKEFPRAIAIAEGLAQRFPRDEEVRQWQAIAYQRWARHLIQKKEAKEYDKARIYLKKALKTDPHNKSLWLEVEKDFQALDRLY